MYMENPHSDSSQSHLSVKLQKSVPQVLQMGKDLGFTCAG